MRGEPKATLPKVYCSSLPRDTALWTSIVFIWVLFWLRVSFYLQWVAKSSNVSASSFFVKLCRSANETLEMFLEASGEHSLSQKSVFEWQSCFKAGRVSVEDERSRRPSTSKTINILKSSRPHPRRPSPPNNPWARRHRWLSVTEFARRT
jgi:hypothetical protein